MQRSAREGRTHFLFPGARRALAPGFSSSTAAVGCSGPTDSITVVQKQETIRSFFCRSIDRNLKNLILHYYRLGRQKDAHLLYDSCVVQGIRSEPTIPQLFGGI